MQEKTFNAPLLLAIAISAIIFGSIGYLIGRNNATPSNKLEPSPVVSVSPKLDVSAGPTLGKTTPTPTINKTSKLQICPDAWYDNQMPGSDQNEVRQYLIVKGRRAEISDYDLNWIKQNCRVNTPTVVQ